MAGTATFGYWVRRQRKALDLTQEALAQQVGCAVVTIRKIEADASRPSRQLAERLADSLVIAPQDRPAFLKAARAVFVDEELPLPDRPANLVPPATERQRSNLPTPPTALLGREQELAAVCERLRRDEVRLVTLTGPGGTGKTRLALEVAQKLAETYPDGVWFVNLAALSDPALVVATIAQTLGVQLPPGGSPATALQGHLSDRTTLLLLDNFEQLVDAAPSVGELLAAAPRLKLLVTSRTPLRLSGEHEIAVAPLGLPDRAESQSPDALLRAPAVRLFVERAQAVRADFVLASENAAAVTAICVQLDGLPLAIELAAARIKLFAPQALLARLGSPFALLTGGARDLPARQQTIRNTIEWSFNLLDADAQQLFVRLGVFVGGFTLAAAEAVCDPDGRLPVALLDAVELLVNQSLLRQAEGPDGEPRFSMLETIRAYALEQLARSGEFAQLQRRHADYYLALAIASAWEGVESFAPWCALLEPEQDNLRAALGWAFEGGDAWAGLRLAGALAPFWYETLAWEEGQRWIEAALALMPKLDHSALAVGERAAIEARLLLGAGMIASVKGDGERALARMRASVALYRQVGDKRRLATALVELGGALEHMSGDYSAAHAVQEEAVALLREFGDEHGLAVALTYLAGATLGLGRNEEARTLFEESLALVRALNPRGVFYPLSGIAGVLLNQGRFTEAEAIYEACLAMAREVGHTWDVAQELFWLGGAVAYQGDYGRATALLEQSLALLREFRHQVRIAEMQNTLGEVALAAGDHVRAEQLHEESLALNSAIGNRRDTARSLRDLGRVATEQGAFAVAASRLAESLTLLRELGDLHGLAVCIGSAAALEGARGRAAHAARLFGAADALRAAHRTPRWHWILFETAEQRERAAARARLGEAAWTEAWTTGRDLSVETAIATLRG